MKVVKYGSGPARMRGALKSIYANATHASAKVEPITKVEVGVVYEHQAGMAKLDAVYVKLTAITEEYRNFFRSEQELENAFRHVEGDQNAFIENLVEFLMIYNSSMELLIEFDKHFKTDHHLNIKSLVEDYTNELAGLDIRIEAEGTLSYVKTSLLKSYGLDVHQYDFFIHEFGMAKLFLQRFRSVKAIILDESQTRVQLDDMQGLVIDRKC